MAEYVYEVSVKGLSTYKVYADNDKEAKVKAIDCFFDDDEFYGLELTENVSEDECEIVWKEDF